MNKLEASLVALHQRAALAVTYMTIVVLIAFCIALVSIHSSTSACGQELNLDVPEWSDLQLHLDRQERQLDDIENTINDIEIEMERNSRPFAQEYLYDRYLSR